MKRSPCALVMVLSLMLFSTSLPASEGPGEQNRYGVGISLFEEFLSFAGSIYVSDLTGGVNIYFPARIGGSFRFEPEIGVMFVGYDFEYDGEDYHGTERIIRIGFGLGPIIQREKLDIYYGLRFGLAFASMKDIERTIYSPEGEEAELSKTDWYLAPALGGEYFVSRHFSVGGEARVEFTFFGEWSETQSITDLYAIRNRNLFFVRWYF